MKEYGKIVDIRNRNAVVMVEKKADEKKCSGCNICTRAGKGEFLFEAPGYDGMQKGDRVIIEIDETAVLRGTFFLYGVPLAGFFLAVTVAHLIELIYLKIIFFLVLFISIWLIGLEKGNAVGKRNRTKIVKQ